MADRHRGNTRDFDRDRGRGFSGPPRGNFSGAPRGDFAGAPRPERREGGPPFRPDARPERSFEPAPFDRDRRPPAAPEEVEDFEDVDADLAVAIIQAATKLTEIVGVAGLPENHGERRAAVVESFETIYFALLDAITGGDEEEEEEGAEE